jgi:hypothetical protein
VARRPAIVALLALLPLLLAGCATGKGGWADSWWVQTVRIGGPKGDYDMEVRYRAGELGRGWSEGSAPPGDFAFYNAELGATVYADSSCGRKFHDASLKVLSNHLTMGFEQVEVLEQTGLTLSDRAALERLSRGSLDGVEVAMATSVVKKDPCVFDLVLVSAPPGFEAALEDYRRFRDAFDAEVRR